MNPHFYFHLTFISGGTAVHFSSNESSIGRKCMHCFCAISSKEFKKKKSFYAIWVFAICFNELGSHAVTFPAPSVKYDKRDSLTPHIIPSALQRWDTSILKVQFYLVLQEHVRDLFQKFDQSGWCLTALVKEHWVT